MRGIHEVNTVFRLLRFLKLTVLFDEGVLPPDIGLARNQRWFFLDESQAMQQLGDPALAISDLPGLLDIVCNLPGGEA